MSSWKKRRIVINDLWPALVSSDESQILTLSCQLVHSQTHYAGLRASNHGPNCTHHRAKSCSLTNTMRSCSQEGKKMLLCKQEQGSSPLAYNGLCCISVAVAADCGKYLLTLAAYHLCISLKLAKWGATLNCFPHMAHERVVVLSAQLTTLPWHSGWQLVMMTGSAVCCATNTGVNRHSQWGRGTSITLTLPY